MERLTVQRQDVSYSSFAEKLGHKNCICSFVRYRVGCVRKWTKLQLHYMTEDGVYVTTQLVTQPVSKWAARFETVLCKYCTVFRLALTKYESGDSEVIVLSWNGSFNCSKFPIPFEKESEDLVAGRLATKNRSDNKKQYSMDQHLPSASIERTSLVTSSFMSSFLISRKLSRITMYDKCGPYRMLALVRFESFSPFDILSGSNSDRNSCSIKIPSRSTSSSMIVCTLCLLIFSWSTVNPTRVVSVLTKS